MFDLVLNRPLFNCHLFMNSDNSDYIIFHTNYDLLREYQFVNHVVHVKGKVSYNSFDSNIELIDGFQNLKNREFEFTNKEKYISVKGKLKQNQSFWKNAIKVNDTVLNIIQEGYRLPFLETPDILDSVILSLQ